MTGTFLGNPWVVVTIYKGDVNITVNSKFWHFTSNVCTLVIPTCTLKDSHEYCMLLNHELGKDHSSCTLLSMMRILPGMEGEHIHPGQGQGPIPAIE